MKSILVFIVFVSAVCLWFFVEQRPNKKYRNFAIVFLVIGSILIYADNKKNEKINETEPKQENSVKNSKAFSSSKALKTRGELYNPQLKELFNKIDQTTILVGDIEEYVDYLYLNKLDNGNSVFRLATISVKSVNDLDSDAIYYDHKELYIEVDNNMLDKLQSLGNNGKYPRLIIGAKVQPKIEFYDGKNNTIEVFLKATAINDNKKNARRNYKCLKHEITLIGGNYFGKRKIY